MMKNQLKNDQTILFIGDSVTDCDRAHSSFSPLGWGYVRMFADILKVRDPDKNINVVNKGINGNTIAHLLSRWCDDVIEYRPDVLVILIGINDVTRFVDNSSSLHKSHQEFAATYRQLVEITRSRLPECRIILMEPFFISKGDDIFGSYRNELISNLNYYIDAVRSIAAEYRLDLIQLSVIFDGLVRSRNSATYSEDKIHPNQTGHFAIAEAVYNCPQKGDSLDV